MGATSVSVEIQNQAQFFSFVYIFFAACFVRRLILSPPFLNLISIYLARYQQKRRTAAVVFGPLGPRWLPVGFALLAATVRR